MVARDCKPRHPPDGTVSADRRPHDPIRPAPTGPAEEAVRCRAGVPGGGAGTAGRPVGASLAAAVLCPARAPVPLPASPAWLSQAAEGRVAARSGAAPKLIGRAWPRSRDSDQGERAGACASSNRMSAGAGTVRAVADADIAAPGNWAPADRPVRPRAVYIQDGNATQGIPAPDPASAYLIPPS